MAPSVPPKAGLVARPPLDVNKKVAIIRKPTDGIVYEDVDGKLQRISDLGKAATTSVGDGPLLFLRSFGLGAAEKKIIVVIFCIDHA